MIKRIELVEQIEDFLGCNYFEKNYIFIVTYEFDNQEYEVVIKFRDVYPLDVILKNVEERITDEIMKRIREQIREKINENDEILKLRMIVKLTE